MKKLLWATTFCLFIFIMKTASAQSGYINHTLKSGETLSALAKQYNTNVGDIMRENGMHADTKLAYGSIIKIPSNKTDKIKTPEPQPVKQEIVAAPANAITHKVVRGETLFSISKQYSISVEQIKSWNNLSDNSAKLGSNLIVGQSNNITTLSKPLADTKRPRVETEQPQVQPQQKNEVNNITEEKKPEDSGIKTNTEIVNKQSSVPADNDNNFTQVSSQSQIDAGYFQDQFDSKGKRKEHITGVSKTFKTASGWTDGKYYILADNINPGTVVKLSADNGKTVYAKVLWSMGDLKENNGADFRVSNATAAALNENASSFNLNIYY